MTTLGMFANGAASWNAMLTADGDTLLEAHLPPERLSDPAAGMPGRG